MIGRTEGPSSFSQPSLELSASGLAESVSHDDLLALLETCCTITSDLQLPNVMYTIVHQAELLLKAKDVCLFTKSPGGNAFLLHRCNRRSFRPPKPRLPIENRIVNRIVSEEGKVLRFEQSNAKAELDDLRNALFGDFTGADPGRTVDSLITAPLRDTCGEIIAILMVMNKLSAGVADAFSERDEKVLSHISIIAGTALENAQRLRDAETSCNQAHGLVQLFASLRTELSLQSSLIELTSRTRELTRTEHCAVFVVDGHHGVLRSLSSDSGEELTWPMDSSDLLMDLITRLKCPMVLQYGDSRIHDITSQKPHVVPADGGTLYAASGSLFRQNNRTLNIMLIPIVADDGTVLGLIETSNKMDEEGECLLFSSEDVLMIESFAHMVSSRLDHSDFGAMARMVVPSEAGRTTDVSLFLQMGISDSSTRVALSNRSSLSNRSTDSDQAISDQGSNPLVGHPLPRRRLSVFASTLQPPPIAEGDEYQADEVEEMRSSRSST